MPRGYYDDGARLQAVRQHKTIEHEHPDLLSPCTVITLFVDGSSNCDTTLCASWYDVIELTYM